MILPILAYGDPVLRKKAEPVEKIDDRLLQLIDDMFETMYAASGVGLAAPQVGESIRLFVIDSEQIKDQDDDEDFIAYKGVFINPEIIELKGDEWAYEEGCLSIPGIREQVYRPQTVRIQYYDENFTLHEREFDDITGRIILHEYDHLEGRLFVDLIPAVRKRIIKPKLEAISRGNVDVRYRMRFPGKKARKVF